MIYILSADKSRYVFVASRDGLGWRSRAGEWVRLKPPWAEALFSERYGGAAVTRLPFGWRIVIGNPIRNP